MSTYLGNQLLAGTSTNVISNAHSLLDFKWTDHILNEMSWLRADTFSWHNGDLYVGAYNHLVADYESAASNTETINGYTITFYTATDGHKIVLTNMETIVQNIYNSTGVAWYYIIDTVNKRFKLPRTKFGFVGLRDSAGNYVAPGLPNITGNVTTVGLGDITTASGSFSLENPLSVGVKGEAGNANKFRDIVLSASSSSSIYGNSDTVQPPATQMYLYFYVGNYDLGDVADIDLVNGVATIDLDNLSSAGKNIANWSNNVTNCITEIPQDIKLELNDGTLTLKAGSKVYVPNGTGVFDKVTVPSDVIFHAGTIGTATAPLMLACDLNGGFGARAQPGSFVSGTTAPSDTTKIWYDTTNNAIKMYNNGAWVRSCSLPFAIYQRTNGEATAIKQVFNGFGYMGSTVFALPGVKGLIPNGRNADGTLNNTEITIDKVITRSDMGSNSSYSFTYNSGEYFNYGDYTISEDNYLNSGYGTHLPEFVCGTYETDANGKIKRLKTKQVFKALDYNDSPTIAGWAMPSDNYIDLTLNTNGSTYTAPANGFVSAYSTNSSSLSLNLVDENDNNLLENGGTFSFNQLEVYIPVRKNQKFKLWYNGTIERFRFIYCEGEI